MIGDLVNGHEPSKIVLIEDTVECAGRALCAAFLVNLASRVEKVHLFQFDLKAKDLVEVIQQSGTQNVQCHNGNTDLLGWKKSPLNIDTDLCKYLQDSGHCHGNQSVAIVIDSLSNHLLHRPAPYTCQTIHRLANKQRGCDVKQVVCLVHHDLHDNQPLALLEHTSTSVVRLKQPFSSLRPFSCIIVHKKPSGKVIKISEEFSISPDFKLTNVQEVKSSGLALVAGEEAQVDPTANLTFNLSLTSKEKEARSNVILPYTKIQDKAKIQDKEENSSGDSKIFYQPDEADDFDEEDPDDDLDI